MNEFHLSGVSLSQPNTEALSHQKNISSIGGSKLPTSLSTSLTPVKAPKSSSLHFLFKGATRALENTNETDGDPFTGVCRKYIIRRSQKPKGLRHISSGAPVSSRRVDFAQMSDR